MAAHPHIRLILTDIDGTLLPYGQALVSERARAAFHKAIDAGIHIGPASGRGFSHIPASFAGDAQCTATCLATNGMQVYMDGKLVHQQYLPREPLVRIADLVRNMAGVGLVCFEDGVPLIVVGNVDDLEKSFPIYAREASWTDEVPPHDIEKANVFVGGSMAYTKEVFDYLVEQTSGVSLNLPMKGFLNILPVGWSKASGIDVLCERLNISLEQVVVFGDGGNDLEMLEHVPNSVAVAGAVPEVASAARWHIGPCEQDSVARAIEMLAIGKWPFVS